MLDVLLLCAALIASGGGEKKKAAEPCPRMSVAGVPASAQHFLLQECGGGLKVEVEGLEVSSPTNTCPLFSIITPAHSVPKPAPESFTFVRPAGTQPVVRIDFACVSHWLLLIIPVVISSSCEKMDESNAGSVADFAVVPCERDEGH